MAGVDTNQQRSAFIAETTAGTTPSTPGFSTLHKAINRNAGPTRAHQASLPAGGGLLGDKLLTNKSSLAMPATPMVYGLFDPLLETLFQSAWATNVLKDGKSFKTVTVENSIPAGIAGTRTYWRDLGVRATRGTLEMQADGIMMLALDFMGMTSQAATTTAISGATYTDPTHFNPFTSAVDCGLVTLSGFTLDGMSEMKINFDFDGIEGQAVQGTSLAGITPGACRVSVDMKFYVDTNFLAMYTAPRQAAAQTATAFSVTMGSVTANKYTFEIPKATIDVGDLDLAAATGYLTAKVVGQYSSSDACVMKLTRAVA